MRVMFYKYLISSLLIIASLHSEAQLLSSEALDTLPTYTLERALKQDPLIVYKLNLKKMKLSELPEAIFKFKNLQVLDVSKNKLKVFPINIGKFEYLQQLDISTNKIEIITKELGELVHLNKLIASSNRLVSIPREIKNLKKLKFLDLWGNDIGALPYEISELENTLEEIDMRVILMSNAEHKKIKTLLPKTKIRFSKSCQCGF